MKGNRIDKKKILTLMGENKYKYYGLRSDDHYEEGQQSRRWELGEPTKSLHDGLCVVQVTSDNIDEAISFVSYYSGSKIFLVGSDAAYTGCDPFEKIFDYCDHKLIAIVSK